MASNHPISIEEFDSHGRNSAKPWVSMNGYVYDISEFKDLHPGGAEIILKYAGRDIGAVMNDVDIHAHSDAAFAQMDNLVIGQLQCKQRAAAEKARLKRSISNTNFLDMSKPLVWQVFTAKFSKAEYIEQIHLARHYPRSVRLFENGILESMTRTPWWVIPTVWLPVIAYFLFVTGKGENVTTRVISVFLGIFLWTLTEYLFHRFLFHSERWIPEWNVAFGVHFLLHGIHHFVPMDK